MNKEAINDCINQYSNAKGQKYPCSNQFVSCFILCDKIDDKVFNFLENKKAHVIFKDRHELRANFENTLWHVIQIRESYRACRYHKAYIDTRINDNIFNEIIRPCMSNYCKEVHFF